MAIISEDTFLTKEDKKLIRGYIDGDKNLRAYLECLLDNCFRANIPLCTPNWHMCYLSEAFNTVCPDYNFKDLCKRKILEAAEK